MTVEDSDNDHRHLVRDIGADSSRAGDDAQHNMFLCELKKVLESGSLTLELHSLKPSQTPWLDILTDMIPAT